MIRPARPKAVVFDHDGTLMDTLEVVVQASNAVLEAEGLPPQDRATIVAGMVLPTPERMGALAGATDPGAMRTLGRAYEAQALELAHRAKPYPGVPELLARLQALDIPMAVVSNSAQAFLSRALAGANLRDAFRMVLGSDDVAQPKPHPDGMRRVLHRLDCLAKRAVYVGDSLTDLRTARNAGTAAIGVTWGAHPREELSLLPFDALIDHPDELMALLPHVTAPSRPSLPDQSTSAVV